MFFYTCVVKFFYKVNFYCLRTIFCLWLTKNEKFINQMKNIFRSSHPAVCCKKGCLKNVTKFTRKNLCQSLFFNKVAGLRPEILFKKSLAQVFSCGFCEFFKNTYSIELLWWLLLYIIFSLSERQN